MNLYGRRRMMQKPEESYVMNGLSLWLDAIDKGNVNGAWVDKISAHEFTAYNGVTFGNDYVELDASQQQYLSNSDYTAPLSADGTIEIVATFTTTGRMLIFTPKTGNGVIAFGTYSESSAIWSIFVNQPVLDYSGESNFSTISVTNGIALRNGVQCGFSSSGNSWSSTSTDTNFIGKRVSGNYFNGKIHAIRIYNRHLTTSEMIQNQRIDNKRFNLGLSI